MPTITIVSKWNYLEEALSGAEELNGFTIETVAKIPDFHSGLIILDEKPGVNLTNTIAIGDVEHADLNKPFKLNDLIRLINSKLQRKVIRLKEFEFDPIKKSLKNNDIEVLITKKEAELLHFLIMNQDQAFQACELLYQVWGYGDDIKTNTLDTHLYGLRKSLEAIGIKNLIKQQGGKYHIVLN